MTMEILNACSLSFIASEHTLSWSLEAIAILWRLSRLTVWITKGVVRHPSRSRVHWVSWNVCVIRNTTYHIAKKFYSRETSPSPATFVWNILPIQYKDCCFLHENYTAHVIVQHCVLLQTMPYMYTCMCAPSFVG